MRECVSAVILHARNCSSLRGTTRALSTAMAETERDKPRPVIDESTYAGSSSETGGNYADSGPTVANPDGDTMSEEEERDTRPPEGPAA